MTETDISRDLRGATEAHRRLVAAIATITDADISAASLLPGWTIGHVLAHLARNADSHVRMIAAAEAGEVADQYPGGIEQRSGDIERDAQRGAHEQLADLVESIEALHACWAATTERGWAGTARTFAGPVATTDLPFRRWRETEVHHVDLGTWAGGSYGFEQWPAEYVRLELGRMMMLWSSRRPMGMTELPPEALAAPERTRLAWLIGRTEIPGLPAANIFA